MSRISTISIFLLAVFLQAGAYGLTFLLPRLFEQFGADEKAVGTILMVATISTLIAVYFAGHLSDWFGRMITLALACLSIAVAIVLYSITVSIGIVPILASLLLGAGWGLTYALVPVVLTRLVSSDERVRYFAMNSVVLMAGFGLSPVMASEIENGGGTLQQSFLIIAGLSTVSAFIFWALRGAVRNHSMGSGPETSSRLSLGKVGFILRTKAWLSIVMVCIGASVFSSMNNFQTVFADARGLQYADFFLAYTISVIICRIVLARYRGGSQPYLTISLLQYVMAASALLFIYSGVSVSLYILVAILFGIGYGASYPILAAMAANDAHEEFVPQTLQFFALTYFIGIFGFPFVAGWVIVELGSTTLLYLVVFMSALEATMAALRARHDGRSNLIG